MHSEVPKFVALFGRRSDLQKHGFLASRIPNLQNLKRSVAQFTSPHLHYTIPGSFSTKLLKIWWVWFKMVTRFLHMVTRHYEIRRAMGCHAVAIESPCAWDLHRLRDPEPDPAFQEAPSKKGPLGPGLLFFR